MYLLLNSLVIRRLKIPKKKKKSKCKIQVRGDFMEVIKFNIPLREKMGFPSLGWLVVKEGKVGKRITECVCTTITLIVFFFFFFPGKF